MYASAHAFRGRGGKEARAEVHMRHQETRMAAAHPKGSPTTRKATSSLSAPSRMTSMLLSTISLSAMVTSFP